MLSFPVEIVLKGREVAVREVVSAAVPGPATWDDEAVRAVLIAILRAIERAEHPDASPNRVVLLRGFSWIVEPAGQQVVLAIEIPKGAAVAGPFAVGQADLTALISRVLQTERQLTSAPGTIH